MSQFRDQLGIIGGGVMAEAILSRLLSEKICSPEQVQVSDISKERLENLVDRYQIQGSTNNDVVASNSQVLLLAIKPQIFAKVATPLASSIPAECLVLSILAGVTLGTLEAAFPGSPVIRVMPNTPATVGAGMAAIAAGNHANQTHLDLAHRLFSAVGQAVTVPESLMDAVTGLSGSGPAYVALVLESLTDGGVSVGLPRPIAAQLALQTLLGTAKLVDETGLHPAQLKDQVTSPGGTTIAGVAALEQAGIRSALIKAVQAAYHRSCELGQG